MKKLLVMMVPAALMAGLLTAGGTAPATGATARRDTCTTPEKRTLTTTKGATVWIPSSRSAGPFQWGGNQSLSTSDGRLRATSHGSSDSAGGTAGVSFPLVDVQAKYEHQWNRSTTVTKSFTQTFTTNSGEVSRKLHWRWRLYMRGFVFTATETQYFPVPCATTKRVLKSRVVLPGARKIYSFDIEPYRTRNHLHDSHGDPI